MLTPINKLVLLGTGNVASAIAGACSSAGFSLIRIWSRDIKKAESFAGRYKTAFTEDLKNIAEGADLCIIAVTDTAIAGVASQIVANGCLVVHTAGTEDINVLNPCGPRTGVFYPLQTFSADRKPDFSTIPLCIETAREKDFQILKAFSQKLSSNVIQVSSADRKMLHLAAVFACNFVNMNYSIAEEILARANVPFGILLPLITETLEKAVACGPLRSQTGPAIRGDQKTINRQMELLNQRPDLQAIYRLMTEYIHKNIRKNE